MSHQNHRSQEQGRAPGQQDGPLQDSFEVDDETRQPNDGQQKAQADALQQVKWQRI